MTSTVAALLFKKWLAEEVSRALKAEGFKRSGARFVAPCGSNAAAAALTRLLL